MSSRSTGLTARIAQTNALYNRRRGTLRGMHYQAPPHAEAKIFRVTRGAIYDVIVDLRPGSETYGRWESFRLSAERPAHAVRARGLRPGLPDARGPHRARVLRRRPSTRPSSSAGFRYDDPAFDARVAAPGGGHLRERPELA